MFKRKESIVFGTQTLNQQQMFQEMVELEDLKNLELKERRIISWPDIVPEIKVIFSELHKL